MSGPGLLRWFWSALCWSNKVSISFRPQGVDSDFRPYSQVQLLYIQQRIFPTEALAARRL